MPFVRIQPSWQLPASQVTPESVWNRRKFLRAAAGASIGASVFSLAGCKARSSAAIPPEDWEKLPPPPPTEMQPPFREVERNRKFTNPHRPLTERSLAESYNNFYEFGGTKDIVKRAQALPIDPWSVEVTGRVKRPQTYDRDDLFKAFPLEERIYRFRCVEAWAMVVPWLGFPMRRLVEAVEPESDAKFVSFTSFYDPKITPGPGWALGRLPWPYVEGLTLEEMANDLAFFAVGIYGATLPKQNGAPIRAVLPWKYGFKGGKSIVKIEFLSERPATFWNTLAPDEYGFTANVNPKVPHPRWSQATERLMGSGPAIAWERVPTLPYNGYEEYVADLYA